jgi:C1A family cysteine protease
MSIDREQMYSYPFNLVSSDSFGSDDYYDFKYPKIIGLKKSTTFNENLLHAMVIVGYEDKYNAFKVLNSWGPNWGYGGFCYMSYDLFNTALFRKNFVISALVIDRVLI